jgi:hypothetical protein
LAERAEELRSREKKKKQRIEVAGRPARYFMG